MEEAILSYILNTTEDRIGKMPYKGINHHNGAA
jgi:hypothetical protein